MFNHVCSTIRTRHSVTIDETTCERTSRHVASAFFTLREFEITGVMNYNPYGKLLEFSFYLTVLGGANVRLRVSGDILNIYNLINDC